MQEFKHHILIVDDDNRILTLLQKFLSQNGFLVSIASSAIEATALIKNYVYDLIILDVMLPEVTGLEFAKIIKAGHYNMPIVMLTALSDTGDKIRGLESGAADYLTKPFEPRELLLRIRNLINTHNQNKKSSAIQYFGNNWYNFHSKEFVKQNNKLLLSSTEFKLLEIFINKANQTITRDELSTQMGGLSLRSIDVQIVRIRNKIEDDPKTPKYLRTVRNKGYALYI
jgi:two-component system phosphate regulon response regulator OmpR